MKQRQLHDVTRNIYILGFSSPHIRGLTVEYICRGYFGMRRCKTLAPISGYIIFPQRKTRAAHDWRTSILRWRHMGVMTSQPVATRLIAKQLVQAENKGNTSHRITGLYEGNMIEGNMIWGGFPSQRVGNVDIVSCHESSWILENMWILFRSPDALAATLLKNLFRNLGLFIYQGDVHFVNSLSVYYIGSRRFAGIFYTCTWWLFSVILPFSFI